MDAQQYLNIDSEVVERPMVREASVCRNADKPLNGCLPLIGDYAKLYIKADKEIPIGETKGLIKVKIEKIDNDRFCGAVSDSLYGNLIPLGAKVSFAFNRIFSVSDI